MCRKIFPVLVLALLFAGFAEAASFVPLDRADTWDFSIMTRYSWSQDFTGDNGETLSLSDDLGWGFGFGYNISDSFNLGLEFLWHSFHYTANLVSEDDPSVTTPYSNVMDTSAFVFTGEYTIGKKRLMPYLSGNLGWMAVNTNITAGISSGCWWYPYYGYVCSAYPETYGSDEFTYGLGLGLRFQMTPGSFLKIGYEHSWVDINSYDGNDVMRIDVGFGL